MRSLCSLVLLLGACGDEPKTEVVVDAPDTFAMISAEPMSFDFGPVGVDTSSVFAPITVHNSGTRSSGTLNVQLVYTDANLFRIINNGCTGGIIAPQGTCILQLQFRPDTASGMKEAHLLIDATPGGELLVPLTGMGAPNTGPHFTTPSTQASFGDQANHTLSGTFVFQIRNPGNAPTGQVLLMVNGVNASAYSVETSCSAPLPPNGMCTVGVRFHPTMLGIQPVTIDLTANPGGSLELGVTGNAVDIAMAAMPTTNDFGPVSSGAVSTVMVKLTNSGTHASGIITTMISGPDANAFQIGTDGCTGINIGPGSSCFIDLTFAPGALGAKTAVFEANASNSKATVTLSGMSVP
jgi:hypothetical protein